MTLREIKLQLAKIVAKLGAVTLEDGTVLNYTEESLGAGTALFKEDNEGNFAPVEDGEYTTDGGVKYSTKNGTVTEIITPETAVENVPAPAIDVPEPITPAAEPAKEPEITEPTPEPETPAEEPNKENEEIAGLKAEVADLKAIIAAMKEQIAQFGKMSAAPSVKEEIKEAKVQEDSFAARLAELKECFK